MRGLGEEQLADWRNRYKGAEVQVLDGGHRLRIQHKGCSADWMEVVRARGQVIWVGDFEPIIYRDHHDRDLIGWLRLMCGSYATSPSYGAQKIRLGMSCWASAAQRVADSPLRDLDLAQREAVEYLEEWHAEAICDVEGVQALTQIDEQYNSAARAVRHAETLDEVYSAVMEVCPDAFEANFGVTIPDGLWRTIAAAEAMLAHLEAHAQEEV